MRLCIFFGFALAVGVFDSDAPAHQFYVSVSTVKWNAKESRLDVSIRIFTNDLERAVEHRGGPRLNLWTPREHPDSNRLIETYVASRLTWRINGRQVLMKYLGKADALDATACLFQISDIETVKTIEVQNQILTELIDDQTNIMRFEIKGKKKFLNLNKQMSKDVVAFDR